MPGPSGPTPGTQMRLKRTYDVTFDAVRQAVHIRLGWNNDCDADGRERFRAHLKALGCRVTG